MKNGIELALKEINSKEQNEKFKVVYEDVENNSSKAVSAVQKMIAQLKLPAIIGGAGSSAAMALAPITDKNKKVIRIIKGMIFWRTILYERY